MVVIYYSSVPRNYLSYAGVGELNSVAGCMGSGYIPVGAGVRKRKPRSDKGKKKKSN